MPDNIALPLLIYICAVNEEGFAVLWTKIDCARYYNSIRESVQA